MDEILKNIKYNYLYNIFIKILVKVVLSMDKKYIVIIIVIIFLAIIGFSFLNKSPVQVESFDVGSAKFILPDGYHVGNSNDSNKVNITNGVNSIQLIEYKDKQITKHVENYEHYIINQNGTVKTENFTIDNVTIYKSVNEKYPNIVHYWFIKNGKTYEVSKYDANKRMDTMVINLIDSFGKTS